MSESIKRLSIAAIKQANANAGQHWFEPGALRFFNSTVLPTVYQGPGGVFFITSERYSLDKPLRYSVREAIEGGKRIDTVGDFQAHDSKDSAARVAKLKAAGATEIYERKASAAEIGAVKKVAPKATKPAPPKPVAPASKKTARKRTAAKTATQAKSPAKVDEARRLLGSVDTPPERKAAAALREMVAALVRAEHVDTCEDAWDALAVARKHRTAARNHLLAVPTSLATRSADLVKTLRLADAHADEIVRKLGWCQGLGGKGPVES